MSAEHEHEAYTRRDLARLLKLSVDGVDHLRERHVLPPPAIESGRILRWSRQQVEEVLRGRESG
jgi:hypothetical protein